MRALDQLKKAVSMTPQRKVIDLPNGEEFEYWMTPLTLAERGRAQKQAKGDDPTDFALQLLVSKARDENNAPMFSQGDVAELRNALPASLVEELMLQIIAGEELEEEDQEKLDPKPSRRSSRKTSG